MPGKKPLVQTIFQLVVLLCLIGSSSFVAAQDELLRPEQAFELSAWVEDDRIIAEYQIAPGYYMYRKRFNYQIESANATFGNAVFPAGKIINDEFFGDMEIYRDSLRVSLPVTYQSANTQTLRVRSSGQGCADIGVCYPPLQQILTFDTQSAARVYPTAYDPTAESPDTQQVETLQSLLAEANANAQSAKSNGLDSADQNSSNALSILQSLGEEIGLSDEDEIPHPDTAFQLSAELTANNTIHSEIIIYPNTYLYRDKLKVDLINGSGHRLGDINLPAGDAKTDEFLGETEVFHDLVKVSIPITSETMASEFYTLSYQYQGCVEDRICYPPVTKYLRINSTSGQISIGDQLMDSESDSLAIKTETPVTSTQSDSVNVQSEQGEFASLLQSKNIFLIVGLFFLAGVGLTFTPCVFPMIPILSSIIAGQGDSITTAKAFTLSLVYVLSMAVTYAIAGAIVGYYGAEYNIQVWFQDPIVLSVFAAIFVLLALSMFGFYDIQMPAAIQSRITAFSNNQQGGTLIGVGLMGFFSAIIVGPCITAPLVGALIFISQTQDWQLGGLALFALGLGMGTPLLLIGTSAGNILPRAGGWMDAVKAFFGVALLAVAIWLLERVLPVSITMALIAALLMISAIYMNALDSLGESALGWHKLRKGIGIVLLLYGASYLIGAVAGSQDLLQPLRGVFGGSGNTTQIETSHVQFKQIKGQQGLQQALDQSVQQQRNTMLDFYADWCISCKEMERYAFTHPQVLKALAQVNSLQTDVTANDAIDTAFMNSLGIYGPPAILFFDEQGQEIGHRRVVGEMSGDEFAAHLLATF